MIIEILSRLGDVMSHVRALSWLSSKGKLHLALFVTQGHNDSGRYKLRNRMIVASVDESMAKDDFIHIYALMSHYDFTIDLVQSYFIDGAIQALARDPFNYEFKLHFMETILENINSEQAQ